MLFYAGLFETFSVFFCKKSGFASRGI